MELELRDEVAAGTLVALRMANAKPEKALKLVLPVRSQMRRLLRYSCRIYLPVPLPA